MLQSLSSYFLELNPSQVWAQHGNRVLAFPQLASLSLDWQMSWLAATLSPYSTGFWLYLFENKDFANLGLLPGVNPFVYRILPSLTPPHQVRASQPAAERGITAPHENQR